MALSLRWVTDLMNEFLLENDKFIDFFPATIPELQRQILLKLPGFISTPAAST
jgi:hypothetical protein